MIFNTQNVIITDLDVKRFMTPQDQEQFDDQKFNEKIYKSEMGFRVKFPDQIYFRNYNGKPSTIYLEKFKAENMEPIITIVDNKSERVRLNSPITTEEYQNLINSKNKDVDLTDLRRDPQTEVRNAKSVKEANGMERARE